MAIKIKSKLPTKQEPKQEPKQEVKEIYPDFIDDDGYVNKYDYDGRQYYTTSISMKGPKGNPGPPGRMGKDGITPHINPENHHWMIGDIDTGVNAERTSIVVDTLPTPSEETKDQIYVAPSEHTETGDIYSEYVTVYKNGAYSWEKMGTPINVMGASGNNHRSGLVPDTPSTAGTTKFLREDGTWQEPAGGSAAAYTPTLQSVPTSSTTTYIKDGQTVDFEIGQFCRVPNINGTYTFYQLYDLVIDGNTTAAVWQEVLVDEDFSLAITVLGADDIPQFDVTESYAISDFVMKDGKLYKFLTGHTPGVWNPQEVQQTNLVTEVDNMVKSDYEEVIIDLKTETNDPLPNVEVVVTVEGEQSGRNLTTDAQGRCTTNVQKGLEYTVSCANVPNYLPVTDIVRRASLPTRYITVTYVEDDTLTRETVKITVGYSDPTLPKATWVRISYGGENYQLALNDQNIAETTVRLGTVYTVSFEDIDGYKTPSPQTYTASLHGTRNINVSYVAPVAGLKWLMTNNTERELNDVSDAERINGDIFGLIVQTSDLMAAGCSFVIPLPFLLTQDATGTGQWLSANVTVPQLNYFGSLQAALADFDGDANCAGIEQFIAEAAQQGTTYTSSMVSNCRGRVGGAPSFDDTKDYEAGDYVVYRNYLHLFLVDHAAGPWVEGETQQMTGFLMPDGVVRKCFSPAFAQIYAFRLLRDKVNEFTTSVFGIGSCNIASDGWWSSTQCSAYNGALLYNGEFNYDFIKNRDYLLLPVLAY